MLSVDSCRRPRVRSRTFSAVDTLLLAAAAAARAPSAPSLPRTPDDVIAGRASGALADWQWAQKCASADFQRPAAAAADFGPAWAPPHPRLPLPPTPAATPDTPIPIALIPPTPTPSDAIGTPAAVQNRPPEWLAPRRKKPRPPPEEGRCAHGAGEGVCFACHLERVPPKFDGFRSLPADFERGRMARKAGSGVQAQSKLAAKCPARPGSRCSIASSAASGATDNTAAYPMPPGRLIDSPSTLCGEAREPQPAVWAAPWDKPMEPAVATKTVDGGWTRRSPSPAASVRGVMLDGEAHWTGLPTFVEA